MWPIVPVIEICKFCSKIHKYMGIFCNVGKERNDKSDAIICWHFIFSNQIHFVKQNFHEILRFSPKEDCINYYDMNCFHFFPNRKYVCIKV